MPTPLDYDLMMKNPALWSALYGDWVLVMNTKSGICPQNHKFTIEGKSGSLRERELSSQ